LDRVAAVVPAATVTSDMAATRPRCDFGGFCRRPDGHRGAHLASTYQWAGADERQVERDHARAVLAALDFPAPDVGPFGDPAGG
jgi:hypothetical protein